jgi:hypothetical protein
MHSSKLAAAGCSNAALNITCVSCNWFGHAVLLQSPPAAAVHAMSDLFPVLVVHPAADVISTVEFNSDGSYLATGDKGGRVVLFEKVHSQAVSAAAAAAATIPTATAALKRVS